MEADRESGLAADDYHGGDGSSSWNEVYISYAGDALDLGDWDSVTTEGRCAPPYGQKVEFQCTCLS